jgi:phenylalanyl-tRNA synthetase beta chain
LQQIGCVVASVDGGFEVIAPTWRPDITHKTDLVEEIARIGGYHRIPSRLPVAPPGRGLSTTQKRRRAIVNALAGSGHVEVLTYPFLSTEANAWFSENKSRPVVKLANALQEDAAEMRTAILPGLIEAAKRNYSRGLTDLAIFEEGSVFEPISVIGKNPTLPVGNELPSPSELSALKATIPAQPKHLAVLFAGNRVADQVGLSAIPADFKDAIQAVRVAAHAVGVEPIVRQATPAGFHPGRTAEIFVETASGELSIGFAGELDPQLALDNNLPRRIAAVEINLDRLYAAAPNVVQASEIGTMPAATQDLSLVVDAALPAAELLNTISAGAGELLENVVLVDDYRGDNVEAGKKSLTFALRFRAADRTLTQAEASEARDAAVALANAKFGATLRA